MRRFVYVAAGQMIRFSHIDDFLHPRPFREGAGEGWIFSDALTLNLILTPLQKNILETMLCDTDNKSLLVEDQPYPIPSRIWERLSRPVGERI